MAKAVAFVHSGEYHLAAHQYRQARYAAVAMVKANIWDEQWHKRLAISFGLFVAFQTMAYRRHQSRRSLC